MAPSKPLSNCRNLAIALPILWVSACSDIKSDKDIPTTITDDPVVTGAVGPDHDLSVIVGLSPVHQTMEDMDAGRFVLRAGGQEWAFTRPIDWAADPFDDLNWRLELNKLVMIDPYLTAYETSENKMAFRKAVKIVLDWQSFHQDNAKTTSVSWLDMVAGQRAARLAYIISEAELDSTLIDRVDLSNLIRLADFHVQRMQGPEFMPDDNHGIFDALGVAALCATLDALPTCPSGRDKAQRRMREIFFLQFAEDGGHREHSPLYHYFALNAFAKAFDSGLFDGDAGMMARKDKALALRPWFLDASGRTPAIGDSERLVAYAGDSLTCDGGQETCVKAALLPKSGYALIHNIDSTPSNRGSVMMSCSFHSYIHKHLDELSFEWIEQGQHILVDSGKYSYDNNAARHYMLSRRAHNTVEYKDEHFSMKNETFPGACLNSLEDNSGTLIISGEYIVPGTRRQHKRELTYEPGKSVYVRDTFGSSVDKPVKQYWHFAPGFKHVDGINTQMASESLTVSVLTPVACTTEIIQGREGRNYQGWVATGYRKRVQAPVVEISCPVGTQEISTRLEIVGNTSPTKDISITTF